MFRKTNLRSRKTNIIKVEKIEIIKVEKIKNINEEEKVII